MYLTSRDCRRLGIDPARGRLVTDPGPSLLGSARSPALRGMPEGLGPEGLPKRWVCQVSGHPPTLNQLMRGKLRIRMRLSRLWREVVAEHWSGLPAAGKRRVGITIVMGPGQRGADPDAYYKGTGDALVACGALRGDSKEWVQWKPVQYRRGEFSETFIELEDD